MNNSRTTVHTMLEVGLSSGSSSENRVSTCWMNSKPHTHFLVARMSKDHLDLVLGLVGRGGGIGVGVAALGVRLHEPLGLLLVAVVGSTGSGAAGHGSDRRATALFRLFLWVGGIVAVGERGLGVRRARRRG